MFVFCSCFHGSGGPALFRPNLLHMKWAPDGAMLYTGYFSALVVARTVMPWLQHVPMLCNTRSHEEFQLLWWNYGARCLWPRNYTVICSAVKMLFSGVLYSWRNVSWNVNSALSWIIHCLSEHPFHISLFT